jgi:hypothetical protein
MVTDSADKCELIGCIVDIFEDFLEEKGVKIPNEERDENNSEAIIYGMDYGILSEQIESTLRAWDLIGDEEEDYVHV